MDLLNSKKYMQQPSTPSPSSPLNLSGHVALPHPRRRRDSPFLISPVNHRLPTQTAHIMPATPGQRPPELTTEAQTSTTMYQETCKRNLPLSLPPRLLPRPTLGLSRQFRFRHRRGRRSSSPVGGCWSCHGGRGSVPGGNSSAAANGGMVAWWLPLGGRDSALPFLTRRRCGCLLGRLLSVLTQACLTTRRRRRRRLLLGLILLSSAFSR